MTAWANSRGEGRNWQPPGHAKRKRRILERDPICKICNAAPSVEVDAIVPDFEGGSHVDDDNLQGLCRACHHEKSAAEAARARRAKYKRARPRERHPGFVDDGGG